MIIRTFGQIAAMTEGTAQGGHESLLILGVSKDTRTLAPGNLYVPLIGERYDGHDYAEAARTAGAAATLWQSDHGEPPEGIPAILVPDALAALQRLAARYREELPVRIVGVTGSNGKTTTKDMIAAVLAGQYVVHKTEGNLNGDIGLPLMVLQMDERTEAAVLEMGMRGFGEIDLLTRIARPEVAVITMIGEAHLERLGSREGIARAKLEIVNGLREGGVLVYNGDEPLLAEQLPLLPKPAGMKTVRFGAEASNDIWPSSVLTDADGAGFTLCGTGAPVFRIPLPGRHNAVNAAAAIAVARHFGIGDELTADGLRTMQPTGMRIERVTGVTGLTVLNDAYNASPASVAASVALLCELSGYRRKIVVLGDMLELGGEEARYHREIGALLTAGSIDYVFTYGPLSVHTKEAAEHSFPAGRVNWFNDKEALVRAIAAVASPQDVVLVKGSRGMRLEEAVERLVAVPL